MKKKIILCLFCLSFALPLLADERLVDDQFEYANGLFNRKLYSMALNEYDKFLGMINKKEKRYAEAVFYMGECHFQLAGPNAEKNYALAIAQYQLILTEFPKHEKMPLARYRIGVCNYFQKRYKEALELLTPLLEMPLIEKVPAETLERVNYYIGRSAFELGDFNKANVYLNALKGSGNERLREESQYFILAGRIKEDNLDAAEKAFIDFETFFKSSRLMGNARLLIANLYQSHKKYETAVGKYRLAVRELSSNPDKAQALKGLGWCYLAQKKYDETLATAAELAALPGHELAVDAAYLQMKVAIEKDESEKALAIFKEMLDKYPAKNSTLESAILDAGWTLRRLKQFPQIVTLSEQFEKDFPNSKQLIIMLFLKGDAYWQAGEAEKALEPLLKVNGREELGIASGICLLDLAYSFRKAKQYPEAAKHFDEFLVKYQKDPLWKDHLPEIYAASAETYLQFERHQKALDRCQEYLDKFPDGKERSRVIYWTGFCYYRLNKFDLMADILGKLPADAETPDSMKLLAWYYFEQKKEFKTAAKIYDRIIAGFEKNYPKDVQEARRYLASCYYELIAADKAYADKAYRSFHEYMNLYPVPDEKLRLPENIFLETASYYMDQKDYAVSRETLYLLLKNYPETQNLETAQMRIIVLCEKLQDWDTLLNESSFFQEKIPESNWSLTVQYYQAIAYKGKNELDKSLELFTKVNGESRDRLKIMSYVELGDIYFSQKKYDDALKNYQHVLVLNIRELKDLGERALSGSAKTVDQLYQLADSPENKSQFLRSAISHYEEFITLFKESPLTPDFKKRLEALKEIQEETSQKK